MAIAFPEAHHWHVLVWSLVYMCIVINKFFFFFFLFCYGIFRLVCGASPLFIRTARRSCRCRCRLWRTLWSRSTKSSPRSTQLRAARALPGSQRWVAERLRQASSSLSEQRSASQNTGERYSFIHSFIHSFTHSLTHSFIHSFIHPFIRLLRQ